MAVIALTAFVERPPAEPNTVRRVRHYHVTGPTIALINVGEMLFRRREDYRSVATVFATLAIMGSGFIWPPQTWWGMTLLCLVAAQMSFVCAVISHNTMHVPVFKPKSLNKAMQVLLTLATGDSVSAFVPSHNLGHHTHLQSAKDTMRTSKLRFRWNLLNQLLFTFVVGRDVVRSTYRYIWAMRTKKRNWFNQWALETSVLAVVFVTLPFVNWHSFLLYIAIPYVFSSWGIIGINFVQHDGCDPDHQYNHSRSFTGRLTNWWTFNNGYHAMHHERPGMHWADLPAAHAKMLSPHVHPSLEQKCLIRYCIKTYIWPGQRLTYDGKPVVLPEPVPDASWIVPPREMPASASFGAEA